MVYDTCGQVLRVDYPTLGINDTIIDVGGYHGAYCNKLKLLHDWNDFGLITKALRDSNVYTCNR